MTTNIQQSFNPVSFNTRSDVLAREYGAVKLWVLNRSYTKDKRQLEICRVIESVELAVTELDGKDGRFVRYNRHHHRLHTPEEFAELLEGAKNHRYYFFNNGTNCHGDAIRLTSIAPFIYMDESEPVYR